MIIKFVETKSWLYLLAYTKNDLSLKELGESQVNTEWPTSDSRWIVDPRLCMLGDPSPYRSDDQHWNKNEMLAAKMDKFLAVSTGALIYVMLQHKTAIENTRSNGVEYGIFG